MAYEMVMPYHLHMPSYFLETFTEYPSLICPGKNKKTVTIHLLRFFTLLEFAVILYKLRA